MDSIPLYRQAKGLKRAGVAINQTTLGNLFHSAATALAPLNERILELIRLDDYVRADETPQRVLSEGKTRRAFVWSFQTDELIAYVHSHTRSGDTAVSVLGGRPGYLQVDGYTGYNAVIIPNGRIRVGCWAHVRQKFHEASTTAPEAKSALELILELYRVEHDAHEGILHTKNTCAFDKPGARRRLNRLALGYESSSHAILRKVLLAKLFATRSDSGKRSAEAPKMHGWPWTTTPVSARCGPSPLAGRTTCLSAMTEPAKTSQA